MQLKSIDNEENISERMVKIASLSNCGRSRPLLHRCSQSDLPSTEHAFSRRNEEKDARYFSLCLTAWFEDVISQVGIWTTFTAACKKRYGNWLPFYPLDENYYPDEINVEDIRFLLWHHIQFSSRDEGRIINPENPGIELIANELYCILDEIYETAPENERLWQFMHPKGKGG